MTRFALAVPKLSPTIEGNLKTLITFTEKASNEGADLVLFPEACLTGLINNDQPDHDLLLGQTVPGSITDKLCSLSAEKNISIALGLLERVKNSLYDTAILISPDQGIVLKYRRMSPGWHGLQADQNRYRQGTGIESCGIAGLRTAFLICGDLFVDAICSRLSAVNPQILFLPMSRSFANGSADQERWNTEELPEYSKRVAAIKVPTLMVNYIGCREQGDTSFGGAVVFSADGQIKDQLPLGKPGMIYFDL
ncbi:MAG: carbon-nitrogen hydrolase family protein [Candidatus Edwardsbacteria bacterium]|nr:carbon-nitrogen hydrolase family protein [Candidatus Edwardsbacteria bacterium]MBU1575804.1 carbon-nitrogen hydrolase family protein [Candidatus Edwardsbacteria bacterium]MBU2463979.1 carbon-nitrogen hydrolase family protein [Candidatus Edwardsbacteria bacterium]MBU2593265.1 carbon-nitrogen hydrolase family protein [Candidatus Edwardsbacteria bacterium]